MREFSGNSSCMHQCPHASALEFSQQHVRAHAYEAACGCVAGGPGARRRPVGASMLSGPRGGGRVTERIAPGSNGARDCCKCIEAAAHLAGPRLFEAEGAASGSATTPTLTEGARGSRTEFPPDGGACNPKAPVGL